MHRPVVLLRMLRTRSCPPPPPVEDEDKGEGGPVIGL